MDENNLADQIPPTIGRYKVGIGGVELMELNTPGLVKRPLDRSAALNPGAWDGFQSAIGHRFL